MANEHDLTITRTLDAERTIVWQAWTDPDSIARWWGPRGVTNPTCEWQAEPGGRIHIVMLAGDELGFMKGQEWPMNGVVHEAIAPEHLDFSATAIMHGRPILETRCTVDLEETPDGKTKMTVRVAIVSATPEAAEPLQGMAQGWNEQLDKLAVFLAR